MILLFETEKATTHTEGKNTYLEGIALRSEVVNKNHRFYPRHVLESAVESLNEKIKEGNAFGCFGHPTSPETDHARISHVVQSFRRRGNDWHARARVIDEGAGNIVKAILKAKGNVGFSSRGTGNTKKSGNHEVVETGYRLHALDCVVDPSIGSFAHVLKESILNESFSPSEAALAIKLMKESKYLSADPRYYEMPFRGHAAFTGLEDDGKTYPERLQDEERALMARLADVQREIALQDPGLDPEKYRTYLQSIKDPVQRARQAREFMDHLRNERMRKMALGHLSRISKYNS